MLPLRKLLNPFIEAIRKIREEKLLSQKFAKKSKV